MKKAALFLNLGTPKSSHIWDIAVYLNEFLTDRRVIPLPYILRQLLVKLYIIPKKILSSTKNYRSIWQEQGSPLAIHSNSFMKAISPILQDKGIEPFFAMRYQGPSIARALDEIYQLSPDSLAIIPLYPQYASATTGSSIAACLQEIQHWDFFPKISINSSLYSEEWFLSLWVKKILRERVPDSHILFCFHGLPKNQVIKTNPRGSCFQNECCRSCIMQGSCYVAQSTYMAEKLAAKLSLKRDEWSVAFQSRLGREEWTAPYLTDHIVSLQRAGITKITIAPLSFIADCIETLEELDREARAIFLQAGGAEFHSISSLNNDIEWVTELSHFIESTI